MLVYRVVAAMGCLCAGTAVAETVEEKYARDLAARQEIQAMAGQGAVGERVSLYDGELSFSVTDVSIPGNSNLPVAIGRYYFPKQQYGLTAPPIRDFGDWALDVPRIEMVNAANLRWTHPNWSDPNARCSVTWDKFKTWVLQGTFGVPFEWQDFFGGIRFVAPGGSRLAMIRATGASNIPLDGKSYPWKAEGDWVFRCVPLVVGEGEGFEAVSPAGVVIRFDRMVTVGGDLVTRYDDLMRRTGSLQRGYYALMPSEVTDRFGNWVRYEYASETSADVIRIHSNDSREIDIHRDAEGDIYRVAAAGKAWTYGYRAGSDDGSSKSLVSVSNPDDTRWTYDLQGLSKRYAWHDNSRSSDGYCNNNWGFDDPQVATVVAPSGLLAKFTTRRLRQIANYGAGCVNRSAMIQAAISVTDVSYSGPGLGSMSWKYEYPEPPGGWDHVCSPGNCPETKAVQVRRPDGSRELHHFGVRFGDFDTMNVGLLLRQQLYSAEGSLAKDTTYERVLDNPGYPYESSLGVNHNAEFEQSLEGRRIPLQSRRVEMDGVVFTYSACRELVGCFDEFGRPLKVVRANSAGHQKTEVTAYRDDLDDWVLGQVSSITVDGLPAWRVDYNDKGMPERTYAFGKLQQINSYSPQGNLSTVTDGGGNTTWVGDYYRGVPRLIGFADSTRRSATVNPDGTIAAVSDESGARTCYEYDPMGRLARITHPSGTQPEVCDVSDWNDTTLGFVKIDAPEYNLPAGHWRRTIRTGNAYRTTYLDAMWRPVLNEEYDAGDPAATRRFGKQAYDSAGRNVFTSYPSSSSNPTQGVWSTYDPLGRRISLSQDSELGVLTTLTEYLPGLQVRVTNPRGYSTTTTYKTFDRPEEAWPISIVHPEDARTDIHRDAFGKPLWIKRSGALAGQPEVVRWFVYDANQQLCKTIEPETSATAMAYDAAGNVAWSAGGQALWSTTACEHTAVPSGVRVTRGYDARNRLATLTFPDGNGSQSWTYTPDGLPQQIVTYNDGGTTTVVNEYAYNTRRLLIREASIQPAWYTWNSTYTFDRNGSIASQTYPTGLQVDYAPNALGQPTKAGSFATGAVYFPNGALKQFTYGNGIVHQMAQNARQLPSRSTDAGVFDFTFTYDANGNTTNIDDVNQVAGYYSGSRNMQYDGLDRLTQAHLHWWSVDSFGYDVLDNMLTKTQFNGSTTVNHQYWHDAGNRLASIRNADTGATVSGFGYDELGNMSNRNGQALDFDHGNRLRSVVGVESYRYDGYGRRVLNWGNNGTNTLSMYSQAGQLLYQRNEASNLGIDHIYLQGSLVATREIPLGGSTAVVHYQHTDALGSPVAKTNETGMPVGRTHFTPFGDAINKNLDGVGYTGHVEDAATGLTYMQQRYYDPALGRFLSVDPVPAGGNKGGNFNRYWYAANNPYKFIDPDGREIRLQWHEVQVAGVSSGKFHTLLTITPENQEAYEHVGAFNANTNADGKHYATLGAGPRSGDLRAGVNREADAKPHSGGVVIPTPSQYKNEDAFIGALFGATKNFSMNTAAAGGGINYSFFPENNPGEFNSNSFVSGLLQATGAQAPELRNSPPGYVTPVPRRHFEELDNKEVK